MNKWSIHCAGNFVKWQPQMPGDILVFWIEASAQVEPTEPGIQRGLWLVKFILLALFASKYYTWMTGI
jgi:hypothetical protein